MKLTRMSVARVALVVALAASLLVTTASPISAAERLRGVERVRDSSLERGSEPHKVAKAWCPDDKVLVGGGAWIHGPQHVVQSIALSRLEPTHDDSGDGIFVAEAQEHGARANGNWFIEVWAICAWEPPGYHVVRSTSALSTLPMKQKAAVCQPGTRALAAGAWATTPDGTEFGAETAVGVGLQVVRASGSGDITRAQAHARPGRITPWSLRAYAICARPPSGYEVVGGVSWQSGSESVKVADATCPGGKERLGVGGAVTNTAPGNVTLSVVAALSRGARAVARENTPTSANWDFMVAQVICARTT